MERTGFSRRGALTSAASLGVALPVLAACGDDDPETASDTSSPSTSSSAPEETETTTPDSEPSDETSGAGGGGLADAAQVPVGGGLILAEEELVITQPTKGDFKGFTAICTHQGCTVTSVTDTINCPCHGSQFSIADGSVVAGPAPSALAAKDLVVESGAINLA